MIFRSYNKGRPLVVCYLLDNAMQLRRDALSELAY